MQARACVSLICSALLLLTIVIAPAAPDRIDLVPFGRVVRFEGDSPEKFDARTLERGPVGWSAWKSAEGEYLIGLTWDEPRDVAEIGLEFREPFPGRDRIRVAVFFQELAEPGRGRLGAD